MEHNTNVLFLNEHLKNKVVLCFSTRLNVAFIYKPIGPITVFLELGSDQLVSKSITSEIPDPSKSPLSHARDLKQ